MDKQKLAMILEEYLRSSLRTFLKLSNRGKERKEIIEMLDKNLFNPKIRRLLRS